MKELGKRAIAKLTDDWAPAEDRKPDLYAKYLEIDERLGARGVPRASAFWKKEIRRFIRSGRFRWVVRKGRRAGGSTEMTKLAIAVSLYGDWDLPPGEVGMIAWLSVERREASTRLRTFPTYLGLLGETFVARGDEVEHKSISPSGRERTCIFRVVTASVTAVVGHTVVFAIMDELSRWRDEATNANPASEVYNSLAPAMATIPSGRIVLLSSPWSETDFHATLFDQGETEEQCVSFCESWVGNPTLTPEGTRKLAASEIVWLREYAAKPSASTTSLIGKDELEFLVRKGATRLPPIPGARHIIGLDVGLRNDRTGIVVARKELRTNPDGTVKDVLVVCAVEHLVPGFLKRISIEEVVAAVAKLARIYPGVVLADMHYFDSVEPALRAMGIEVVEVKMSPAAISDRVAALQAKLSAHAVELVDHPELRKEILQAVVVHAQGGRITCKAPEGRRGLHDDLLAALLNTNDAEQFGKLVACDGEIRIQRGRVSFDASTGTLEVGRTRYFTRTAHGREIERPPPYGTRHFIAWAIECVARGEFSSEVERWIAERGLKPTEARDCPERLDPTFEERRLNEIRNGVPPFATALEESHLEYVMRTARSRD